MKRCGKWNRSIMQTDHVRYICLIKVYQQVESANELLTQKLNNYVVYPEKMKLPSTLSGEAVKMGPFHLSPSFHRRRWVVKCFKLLPQWWNVTEYIYSGTVQAQIWGTCICLDNACSATLHLYSTTLLLLLSDLCKNMHHLQVCWFRRTLSFSPVSHLLCLKRDNFPVVFVCEPRQKLTKLTTQKKYLDVFRLSVSVFCLIRPFLRELRSFIIIILFFI